MRPADGSALRKIRASHGSLKLNVVIDGAYPMEWIVAGEDEFGLDGTLTCERWRIKDRRTWIHSASIDLFGFRTIAAHRLVLGLGSAQTGHCQGQCKECFGGGVFVSGVLYSHGFSYGGWINVHACRCSTAAPSHSRV